MINLLIGSSSAKYAFFAPVFVPMLMQIGISPELTQAAYRVGDSVSNVITPMNPYMIIIIMEVKKYVRGSGLGTIVAMMLPYTVAVITDSLDKYRTAVRPRWRFALSNVVISMNYAMIRRFRENQT